MTTTPGVTTTFVPDFFAVLMSASLRRIPYFRKDGQPVHTKPDGSDWPVERWGLATLGEFGEAANVLKKILRGDAKPSSRALAEEMADGICYLVLWAYHCRIDLRRAVVEKWNKVAEEHGIVERLGIGVDVDVDPSQAIALRGQLDTITQAHDDVVEILHEALRNMVVQPEQRPQKLMDSAVMVRDVATALVSKTEKLGADLYSLRERQMAATNQLEQAKAQLDTATSSLIEVQRLCDRLGVSSQGPSGHIYTIAQRVEIAAGVRQDVARENRGRPKLPPPPKGFSDWLKTMTDEEQDSIFGKEVAQRIRDGEKPGDVFGEQVRLSRAFRLSSPPGGKATLPEAIGLFQVDGEDGSLFIAARDFSHAAERFAKYVRQLNGLPDGEDVDSPKGITRVCDPDDYLPYLPVES